MSTLSNTIMQLVRKEKWLARQIGTAIEISRVFLGKPIRVQLIPIGKDKVQVVFPSYLFQSSISFFAPQEPEVRFCRDKRLLRYLIKSLKKSQLWQYVENKDFVIINAVNKNVTNAKLNKEYNALMADVEVKQIQN